MASRAPTGNPRTTTASGVRRNLFSASLSRRPTTSSTSTSATTLHANEDETARDLIERDESGAVQFTQLNIAPLPADEEKDEREAENKLIETYRKHQQHIDPAEVMATLKASLQAKVASLDEDKWMFEEEDPVPK
ncbi:hypothetical protein M501DRAFT_1000657 [Patellaria atrata CBS 101060]|uniref:Uncharacterized protein n=1 Tax=Patellaria atrata CBS 101060 TaxID=1346257 RepID=A0A9P4VVA1_9PEZI|nr:hypothetical protein M501DRAFT_1000657 [Patellaria atrata CBS 101060]